MTFHTAEFQQEFDNAQRMAQGEPAPLDGLVEHGPEAWAVGLSIEEVQERLDEHAREAWLDEHEREMLWWSTSPARR